MKLEWVSKTEIKLLLSRSQFIDIGAILSVVGAGYRLSVIDQKRAKELARQLRSDD